MNLEERNTKERDIYMTLIYIHTYIHIYIYIHICICILGYLKILGGFFFGEINWMKDIQILISGSYLMEPESPCSISHQASSPQADSEISDQLLEPNPQ